MGATLQVYLMPEAKAAGIDFKGPREGDAGFDLPALEAVTIEPKTSALIRTGLQMAIPLNWVGLIRDRSSVALKGGIVGAGVIDASYRGEVKVLIHNIGPEPLRFEKGARVAQCLVLPHLSGTELAFVDSAETLGSSERGSGGFGSTGA